MSASSLSKSSKFLILQFLVKSCKLHSVFKIPSKSYMLGFVLISSVYYKCSYPANIRLDEDVLKTSFVFVFRRRLQDVLIKTNIFALALRLEKTSWSRPIYSSWLYVFKTSSRRLAKTSSRHLQDVFKTSSRRLQDVLKNVCKTSSRRLAKISSRRFQDVLSS